MCAYPADMCAYQWLENVSFFGKLCLRTKLMIFGHQNRINSVWIQSISCHWSLSITPEIIRKPLGFFVCFFWGGMGGGGVGYRRRSVA